MQQTTLNQKAQTIVSAIKTEELTLKNRYRLLNYQNTLGLVFFLCSLLAFSAVTLLYSTDVISPWLCILLIALITSIAHEIEHDLIHQQYFKKQPLVYHFMMLMVWIMRPNTVSPWYRKKIHLNHHKVSGTKDDLEERLIGSGIKNHLFRLLVICDGLLGLTFNRKTFTQEIKGFRFLEVFHAGFPLTTSYYAVLYSAIVFQGISIFTSVSQAFPSWLQSVESGVNFLAVVFVIPNFIRSVSLNFVTSSIHYYGGVDHLIKQTQVINSWLFTPFQWFCFNFGNTHTIHHFVPNQPFYIRQLISKKIQKVMKANGVRFNDLASIANANKYTEH